VGPKKNRASLLWALLFSIIVIASHHSINATFGYVTFQLSDNNGDDLYPQISEDQVAWRGWDGETYEIFLYDGTSVVQLTDNSFRAKLPQISEGQVTWLGSEGTSQGIFLYNGSVITQLTYSVNDGDARISNGMVTWRAHDGSDHEIFLYDGSTITQISDNNIHDSDPRIDQGQIAWEANDGNDYEIFFYDGSTVSQLTDNNYDDMDPQIDGGQVTWHGRVEDTFEIFLFNGQTVTQLTNNDYDDTSPRISEGLVTWEGRVGSDFEVFLYNGSSVLQLQNNSVTEYMPDILSGNIVWAGDDGNDFEIFMFDGSTVEQITDNDYHDTAPELSEGYITWHGANGDDLEIFIAIDSALIPTRPLIIKERPNDWYIYNITLPCPENSFPYDIVFDGLGNLWISVFPSNLGQTDARLVKVNPNDGSIKEYIMPRVESSPRGLAIDSNNNVWISDNRQNRIDFFNSTSEEFSNSFIIPSDGYGPYDVEIDGSGDVWFSKSNGNSPGLGRINILSGTIEEFSVPDTVGQVLDIEIDEQNDIWFTGTGVGVLRYFQNNGTFRVELEETNPRHLLIDSDNIWVTTIESEMSPEQSYLIHYSRSNNVTIKIKQPGSNERWFINKNSAGIFLGGAILFDNSDYSYTEYGPTNYGQWWGIDTDDKKNVWIVGRENLGAPTIPLLSVITNHTSTLNVRVQDSWGNAISGANVTTSNMTPEEKYGVYSFQNLRLGEYSIEIQKEGYEDYSTTFDLTTFEVISNHTITLNLESINWGLFQSNPSRTGYTNSSTPNSNSTLWNYSIPTREIISSPIIVDNKLYIGDNTGSSGLGIIYCLDAVSGNQIWNSSVGNIGYSIPVIINDQLFIGSMDGKVYCLNASTGVQLWFYSTDGVVYSSPVVSNEKVYIGSMDGYLYCLNVQTGNKIWAFLTNSEIAYTSPSVSNDKVYIGSTDGLFYCLNAFTGELIWNYQTGARIDSSPAIGGGSCIFWF
jgi:outer membrane protein assembly factor BamB